MFFLIGAIALVAVVLMHSVAARAQEFSSDTFVDVPAGAYYEEAAAALLDDGALEEARYLRPTDFATRAEMMKMLVLLNDVDQVTPERPSFNDVAIGAWYYPYIETAASVGWVKGDSDCYHRLIPCYGRPAANLNRAEAATLLARAFHLEPLARAPRFSDVSVGAWYDQTIQAAADHCILQGDANTDRVRPGAMMNRAEMITMFHRAQQNLKYGEDCGVTRPGLVSVAVSDETHLNVLFNVDVTEARAEDAARYLLTRSLDGAEIEIEGATLLDNRTVRLELASAIRADTRYILSMDQLSTEAGTFFNDSISFTSPMEVTEAGLTGVTVRGNSQIELAFNEDLLESRAEDGSRYQVSRLGSSGTFMVQSAILLDSRHVQLNLSGSLVTNTTYRVTVDGLRTTTGSDFDDTFTFSSALEQANLVSVTPLSSTRLRLSFNSDLDIARLSDSNRFVLTSSGGSIVVGSVSNVSARSADLNLDSALKAQTPYRLSANSLLTAGGASFSDSATFTYTMENANFRATLNSVQEVPPTASTGTGSGTFILREDGLQYSITVQGLTASISDAHFHLGAAGVSGGVLAPITFNGNTATGVWTNLTDDQRNAILAGNVYVNIHTITYPNGEIRGQVLAQ